MAINVSEGEMPDDGSNEVTATGPALDRPVCGAARTDAAAEPEAATGKVSAPDSNVTAHSGVFLETQDAAGASEGRDSAADAREGRDSAADAREGRDSAAEAGENMPVTPGNAALIVPAIRAAIGQKFALGASAQGKIRPELLMAIGISALSIGIPVSMCLWSSISPIYLLHFAAVSHTIYAAIAGYDHFFRGRNQGRSTLNKAAKFLSAGPKAALGAIVHYPLQAAQKTLEAGNRPEPGDSAEMQAFAARYLDRASVLGTTPNVIDLGVLLEKVAKLPFPDVKTVAMITPENFFSKLDALHRRLTDAAGLDRGGVVEQEHGKIRALLEQLAALYQHYQDKKEDSQLTIIGSKINDIYANLSPNSVQSLVLAYQPSDTEKSLASLRVVDKGFTLFLLGALWLAELGYQGVSYLAEPAKVVAPQTGSPGFGGTGGGSSKGGTGVSDDLRQEMDRTFEKFSPPSPEGSELEGDQEFYKKHGEMYEDWAKQQNEQDDAQDEPSK